jgi:hypothetical protein
MPRSQRTVATQRVDRALANRAKAKDALAALDTEVANALRMASDAGIKYRELSTMARGHGWALSSARISQLIIDARERAQ